MTERIHFYGFQVPDLKKYLQDRGISCSIGKKIDLVRLCELAEELRLEVLTSANDEEEYSVFDARRRTVAVGNDKIILDPVNAVTEWSKDLASVPDFESCDVLVYLMRWCGWTHERLRLYKQDNGYRLHMACHIDDVKAAYHLHQEYIYLRATCMPETRQNAQPYDVWILANKTTGEILSGGCTCVADNGTCKHCVAFIFSLSSFCERHRDRGTEVGTDMQCIWDKPRKKSNPQKISDIDMRVDQTHPQPTSATTDSYNPIVPIQGPMANHERDFYELCRGTGALLLQTLYDESFVSDDDDDNVVLPSMSDACKNMLPPYDIFSVTEKLKNIFDKKIITEIEDQTKGQDENQEWYEQRIGRITASHFSSVLHFRFTENEENYISKMIMRKTSKASVPSMAFGKLHEPVARQLYFDNYKKQHKHAEIKLCGLYVDSDYPFLGASPDGVIKCKCCGEGLLEIKCSFLYQNKMPKDACIDDHYHVVLDENENIRLKFDSPWYVQIQGQLGVCQKQWCDFVFYTKKGFIVDRIYFDELVFQRIVEKSQMFFEKYLFRALRKL